MADVEVFYGRRQVLSPFQSALDRETSRTSALSCQERIWTLYISMSTKTSLPIVLSLFNIDIEMLKKSITMYNVNINLYLCIISMIDYYYYLFFL